MLIVYYKDANGKITHHHINRNNMTMQELQQAVEKFNTDQKGGGRTAHIAELAEGTLEAYLYDRAEKKYGLAKDTLREAIDALESAQDCLQSLSI